METSKGKPQHSFKGYKSSFPPSYHHENNYNIASSHGIFKTSRIQRHTLKWRKDHYSIGNHRSRLPYKKSDVNSRKSIKSAEDVEEEERKKKLTDTANKLLNKIKTWNAEKNLTEDDSQQNCNTNQVVTENSCKHNEEKINSEGKPKRIAHSKKAKLMKNRTPKSFSQPTKTTRYDVNKETVKDFQNRIQHKLIEEIMQMPKENLQNVLNDPKINPIMEVKMSRLVKENKLLIAQKLRALAESKMKSPGSSTNPQLLVDIDKLIDPVIETDLSVLPFELITQMENVFQVQFDYSPNTDSQVESGVCDSAIDSTSVAEPEIQMEMCIGSEKKNVKLENNEDLSLYECSTDEDDEIVSSRSLGAYQEGIISETHKVARVVKAGEVNTNWKNKKRKLSTVEQPKDSEIELGANKEKYLPREHENVPQEENHHPSNSVSVECVPEEVVQSSSPAVESKSVSCQTDFSSENASTQTPEESSSVQKLYGAPLPKETMDESISSLLEEVNSIQTLTNKLNERRFMIFLQLAKMNPAGSFIGDEATRKNFIETVSDGNIHLVESLKQFFINSRSYSNSRIGESRRKPPYRNKSSTRRQREDKKTNTNQ